MITGWGMCVPPAVLTNADLETLTDTTDEWIVTRTGIAERRISHVDTSDMAAVAAEHALACAGRSAEEIDLLLLATCTPDRLVPSAATTVQDKIGATRAAAMDLNAACSGFLYALATADQMIEAGAADRALVIGAEKLSYWLDFTDRSTSVLFGDGAGAVVVEATGEPGGLLAFELGSDGSAGDILCVRDSGTQGRPAAGRHPVISMEGPAVFRRAVDAMGDSAAAVVAKAGLELADVDLLIPHQANIRIIEATAKRLGLDAAQVFVNIASYGNTSAATIPIALAEALAAGRIRPGHVLVFAAFGGGLTWAAGAYRWGPRTEAIGTSEAALRETDAGALEILASAVELFGTGV
jgi:3-oxoacyl-[acyl-carrier-protein] synthase-3